MGILINGKYYKDKKDAPIQAQAVVGSQLQSYNLESQANKHDMDLIQPWQSDGSPNPDFIKYYPKEGKEYGMEES
jgi:hypothetical protein